MELSRHQKQCIHGSAIHHRPIEAHNAYHIGQIVYLRKLQGSWNPDKGVK
jgi:hypothetical protein